jgi:type II secretory pathway component PulF
LVLNQLADLLKAGITPAEALNQLAARTWSPKMGGAVKRMSAKASAGVPLSEAMEAEPELFAPSTVGAVRSGETSGNLWQSIDVCAKQIMEAQQYTKGFWWVKYFGPVAGFVLVLSLMLRGFLRSGVDAVMADTMQEGTTREQMVDGSLASLSSPAGIFTLAILIALSVGLFWLLSPAAWSFRHKMAMKIPILKAHARGESMSHFLWHMGQLSKAGITPWTAWKLAALAAPNQVMQQELSQAGQGASENMNISLLTQQGRMLPQEYQALLETGEATGTLPQALDQVSIASMQDSQTSSKSFKVAVLVAKGVMMVVVWISAFVIFYFSYMNYALQQMGEV